MGKDEVAVNGKGEIWKLRSGRFRDLGCLGSVLLVPIGNFGG